MSTDLTLRPMTSEDRPAVLDLLTASLAGGPTGERTDEFFAWKHERNPFGPSAAMVAADGDRIAGVRLFLRWDLHGANGTLRAVRAVDTATHPDYQRRGIFSRLTTGLLGQLERDGEVDLVFNTPNANSRPAYLKLGWEEVGTLPLHLSPVHPIRVLRGFRAASAASASSDAPNAAKREPASPPDLDCPLPPASEAFENQGAIAALVEGLGEPRRLHTPLSVDYLRWRYADAPGLDYRWIPHWDGNDLTGVVFGRLRARGSLREFTVSQLLVPEGDKRTARRLLRAARRTNADHVIVHAAPQSETAGAATASGFLKVPGQGIRLFANPRTEAARHATDLDAWALSVGDLEVF